MEKDPARAAIQPGLKISNLVLKNRARIFSPGKRAKKPGNIPCNGISARAEKQEKRWLPLRSRSDFSEIKTIKWRISLISKLIWNMKTSRQG